MKKFSDWFYSGDFLDVWRRLFNVNLAMISVSLLLYYFQNHKGHLYMAAVWFALAILGLFIRKIVIDQSRSR